MSYKDTIKGFKEAISDAPFKIKLLIILLFILLRICAILLYIPLNLWHLAKGGVSLFEIEEKISGIFIALAFTIIVNDIVDELTRGIIEGTCNN